MHTWSVRLHFCFPPREAFSLCLDTQKQLKKYVWMSCFLCFRHKCNCHYAMGSHRQNRLDFLPLPKFFENCRRDRECRRQLSGGDDAIKKSANSLAAALIVRCVNVSVRRSSISSAAGRQRAIVPHWAFAPQLLLLSPFCVTLTLSVVQQQCSVFFMFLSASITNGQCKCMS